MASTSAAAAAYAMSDERGDEFEEMVAVLQLDGVLDFDAVRRAVSSGAIRVRECDTEAPMIQIGSNLYTGQWTQTLGTDMLLCPSPEYHPQSEHQGNQQQMLELVAVSDTRLSAQKILLATDEITNSAATKGGTASTNVLPLGVNSRQKQ